MLLPPGEVTIELDEQERRYAPGETIHGAVCVQADSAFTCRGLSLRLGWNAFGRGDEEKATVFDRVLVTGEVGRGRQRFPFSIELPRSAPPTYRGDSVRLEWQLHATLDARFALDAQSTETIVVERRVQIARTAHLAEFIALPKSERFEVVVGPVYTRSDAAFARGTPFGCLAFVAKALPIDKVTAALVARESTAIVTSDLDGTSTTTTESRDVVFARGSARSVYKRMPRSATPYREAPGAEEQDLFASAPLPSDGQNEYRMLLQVPADAPSTFATDNRKVRWLVRVIGVAGDTTSFDETYELEELSS